MICPVCENWIDSEDENYCRECDEFQTKNGNE